MLTSRNAISKVVLLRPGALGDVLALRPAVRFFREVFPHAQVCVVAPGERGAFFAREGWADRAFDWDRSAFSWLFSGGIDEPPTALRAVFSGSDIIVAYQDFSGEEEEQGFARCLDLLAPAAGKVYCPSRPPQDHDHGQPIGEWLLRAAIAFCATYGLLGDYVADLDILTATRIEMAPPVFPSLDKPYFMLHPGSGSTRKNWPLAHFIELARLLATLTDCDGTPSFSRCLVSSGEADGDLGRRLADAVPGALHAEGLGLEQVAALLAGARLYVGNDSGVSHLAAAVEGPAGETPTAVVLFGPSDATVWAPPGATVVEAGADIGSVGADDVFAVITQILEHRCGCGGH